MLRKSLPYRLFLLMLSLVSACHQQKEPAESRTESLDNFVDGGSLVINDCAEGREEAKDTKVADHPKDVKKALSAVPVEVRKEFFDNFKGNIIVIDSKSESKIKVKDLCFEEVSQKERDTLPDVDSCWKRDPMRIIIAQDKIKHGLVRAFGLFHSEVSSSVRVNDGGKIDFDTDSAPDPTNIKDYLSLALLDDVESSKKFALSNFKSRLPGDFLAFSSLDRGLKWKGLDGEVKREFMNLAFAEAFDSWFCSDESKKTFENEFPKTYAIFSCYAKTIDPSGPNNCGTKATDMELAGKKTMLSAQLCGPYCRNAKIANAQQKDLFVKADKAYVDRLKKENASQDNASLNLRGGRTGGLRGFFNRLFGGATYRPGGSGNPYPGTAGARGAYFPSPATPGAFPNTFRPGNVNPGATFPTPISNPNPAFGRGTGSSEGVGGGDIANQLLEATNQERRNNGILVALTLDSELTAGCAQHAEWMATTGKFTHDKLYDYKYNRNVGENIAMGSHLVVSSVMTMWMNSPGHRANILNPTYTRFGGAVFRGYWCQQFRF